MRVASFFLSFYLLFSGICSGQSQVTTTRNVKFGLNIRFISMDFSSPSNIEVSNIPALMRQVPVHKDDGYLGLPGKIISIPADKIKTTFYISYNPSFAPEIQLWRFRLRGGLNLNVPILPRAIKANYGSTREIHQYDSGTSRGEGTSLVYYAVVASPMPKIGWLGETAYCFNDGTALVAGYAVSRYDLQIRNGWDRFNSLETHNKFNIATNQSTKIYLGWDFPNNRTTPINWYFFAGKMINRSKPTSVGQNIKVSYDNSWFITIGIRSSFTWGKK